VESAERAVLATTLVVLAGLGVRLAGTCGSDGEGEDGAAGPGGRGICFEVVGASARPGLRCLRRPPRAAELALVAPCDDEAARRSVERLLRECPVAGRRLVLAPARVGGACRPRLTELPGAVRLLLGMPVDLRTARRADLEALPGVGPRLAEELLRLRALRSGRIDLRGVTGLGERRRRELERRLVWSTAPARGCRDD
jgi:hypothetical protein